MAVLEQRMMDYARLIEDLSRSFTAQIVQYKELLVLAQKILGQVTLARGDFSSVIGLFEKKRLLLQNIEKLRDEAKENVAIWKEAKDTIPLSDKRTGFEKTLAETECVIQDFLESENRLKRYFESAMDTDRTESVTGPDAENAGTYPISGHEANILSGRDMRGNSATT